MGWGQVTTAAESWEGILNHNAATAPPHLLVGLHLVIEDQVHRLTKSQGKTKLVANLDGPKVWLVSDEVTEHFEQFNSDFDQTCKAFKMLKVFDGFDMLLAEDAVG